MERVLDKCRLCLKELAQDRIDLFEDMNGFCYAEVILQDLCIEVNQSSTYIQDKLKIKYLYIVLSSF